MWNRKSLLQNAIADWQDRGFIDADTAAKLKADSESQTSNFSFQNILILLAVICLGFAAMTFVAANWEDMARLTRVGIVFAAMWVFWGASALFHLRGHSWFAQVFTLGACAMFGAGIMLISQIYHIQGAAKDATWLWAVGTLLAATLTRSIPALALSIMLLTIWSWLEPSMFSWRNPQIQYAFPAYMIVCGLLAHWMHSRFCAHLIVFATCAWAGPSAMALVDKETLTFPSLVIAGSFGLISLMLLSDRAYTWLRGFERAVIFYALGLIGMICFIWSYEVTSSAFNAFQNIPTLLIGIAAVLFTAGLALFGRLSSNPNTYDLIAAAAFTFLTFGCMVLGDGETLRFMALLLAASIWIIRMGWRIEYRPIAVLGFIAFGLMMLWIYFETIGTLLGTSVFYAIAGMLLLAGVFIIPRLTRTPTAEDTQ